VADKIITSSAQVLLELQHTVPVPHISSELFMSSDVRFHIKGNVNKQKLLLEKSGFL
jgi:hypothetical protein